MRFVLGIVLFLAAPLALADFKPTKAPVSPDGVQATVDLPATQHLRNTGGSDGAGLCVPTSIQMSAYWQNVRVLDGFRAWCEKRPGGSYPEKLDDYLAKFCREKGVSVPPYIQHTAGDAEFLELALRTGRLPAVTYAGRDDFYNWRIAHMVSLAHLDATSAAIIDNNRTGSWVWMTRAEFLTRWRDMQGGWAVVLLAPAPPTHPDTARERVCLCEEGKCKCKDGECPAKCPVAKAGLCDCCKGGCTCYPPSRIDKSCKCAPCKCGVPEFEQCPDGRCPAIRAAPLARAAPLYNGPIPPGAPPSDLYEWGLMPNGNGYGWRLKTAPEAKPLPAQDYGVSPEKIHTHPAYSVCGVPCSKSQAHAILAAGSSLTDDSDKWHLSAVGDEAFTARFLADVAALAPDVRGKLLVQAYAPDHWAVALFRLPSGVNLRKPSVTRFSADVGTVAPGDYSAQALADLLAREGGPTWRPKPKQPDPAPQPKPVPDPKQPDVPKPEPKQPDVPKPADPMFPLCCLVALLLVAVSRRQG